MKRTEILETANHYITKDRAATHGGAEDSFGAIAAMWSAYLDHEVTSADVCAMMVLLKVARFKNTPGHLDHAVDMAGYAALAGEIAAREDHKKVLEEVQKVLDTQEEVL